MTIEITDTIINEAPRGKDPDEGERESALLGQVILELNIARKNFAIYPYGHSQIAISVDKVYGQLSRLMNSRQALIIGAAKGCIFTDNTQLDAKNPVYREFSNALHSLNIAAISFDNGLTKQEVFDFLKIISGGMEVRDGGNDVSLAMNAAGVEHIRIETIDYALFYLTEESEIGAFESSKPPIHIDIWHEFIGNLFSEQRVDKIRRDHLVRLKPSEFAAEVNDRKIDLAMALQNYQKIFADPSLPEMRNQIDERVDLLFKNLQPEIRQQFLSITFDAVSRGSDDLLEYYSNDMVIEMLQQASSRNKQLSPSLITLLEKLSHTQVSMPLHSGQTRLVNADSAVAKEYLQKLLDREFHENYVDDGYGAMLRQLGKTNFQAGPHQPVLPPISVPHETNPPLKSFDGPGVSESYLNFFDDEYLDRRITLMSLGILDQNLSIADYTGFSEKLVMGADHLISIGAFDIVLMIIQTFRRHGQEKSGAIRLCAQEFLQMLTISDITTRVLQMLQNGSSDQVSVATDILSAFGKSAIPGIMDIYIVSESPNVSRVMFELLEGLGMDALEEAYTRLHDSRIPVLRKVLAFIRKIGNCASIGHIRPVISHDDPIVRLDALTALLHLRDSDAAAFLRRALQSSDLRECLGAIQLSGYYRVGEVTKDLNDLLIKSPWRRLDFRKNMAIIKSLGKIGDSCALPVLEKLAAKSLAIYPEDLRKMKVAVFESLNGYSRESLAGILSIGEKSDDYRIRDICKALS